MSSLSVTPLHSIGEVTAGSDLAELIIVAASSEGVDLADRDVLVVTQKVVSKAEDAIEAVDPLDPLSHKPLVEREAVRVLRRRENCFSPRPVTVSSAPTLASTCPMSSRERRPCCRRTRTARPAGYGTLCWAAPVWRWAWSCRTRSVDPGGEGSPTWRSGPRGAAGGGSPGHPRCLRSGAAGDGGSRGR
ncbi:MAG: coenzyme F420-0:L-glutamate ligase [Microthrixaceae bacterium]